MVNKIFTILLVIPAFASIMLFSTFMTPVSAGNPGPDFIGTPVTPVLLNIDLSTTLASAASLDGESEIRGGYVAPTQPGWENHSAVETTEGTTYYATSQQLLPSIAAIDVTFGTPVVNFEGISINGAVPPDTNADVGPNHVIQMVNTQFQIYDKLGNPQT